MPDAPTDADPDGPTSDPFDDLLREVAATPTATGALPSPLPSSRYRIIELIGRGGGGHVYKAFDEQLGRSVALKFLNAAGHARLVNEARMQARVQHPGVCQVYEVSDEGTQPFIAMQLINGPTLNDAARANQLTQEELIDAVRQAAEAVEAAHQLGIVHRDLKPANIMIERVTDGVRAYVLDFGLAREVDKTLTSGGVGTPHFMAPEQAREDATAIGKPTDVWALGATLYAVLAGKPPFEADSVINVLRRVENDEPARLSSVPAALEAIVMRCLEKTPARRYAAAAALARDLSAYARGEVVSARPPRLANRLWRRTRRWRGVLFVAMIAAIVTPIALYRALQWEPIVRELQPTYQEGASAPLISPDGKMLFFDSDRSRELKLYVQSVEGGPVRFLDTEGPASALSWSTDGHFVYYIRERVPGNHVMRMPLNGESPPIEVADARVVRECAGRLFYRTLDKGFERIMMREPNGEERELVRAPNGFGDLACSADGQRIAYRRDQAVAMSWRDVHDGVEHVLPLLGEATEHPCFHPHRASLIVTVDQGTRQTLWEQRLDGTAARQLTNDGHEIDAQLTPDGRRLFFNRARLKESIIGIRLDGSSSRAPGFTDGWKDASPTADGREIISWRVGEDGGAIVAALSLIDGSERTLAKGWGPVVAPNDNDIYYVDDEPHQHRIWVVSRQGQGQRQGARVFASLPSEITELRAGLDGLHLGLTDETRHAWFVPYDGSAGRPEGPPGVELIEPAADGWRMAIGPTRHTVLIPPGTSGEPLPAETHYQLAQLTHDRRAFMALDDTFQMWLVEIASGKARSVGDERVNAAALSPDGKTAYALKATSSTTRAELVSYGKLGPL